MIAHAHRRIEQLQCQVAEQQALESQRTMTALDRQKQADRAESDERVSRELERLRAEFELEKRRMVSIGQELGVTKTFPVVILTLALP